jgi:dUTPase
MAGEVDSDYREEIKVVLMNQGAESVILKPGDRIAQARWTLTLPAPGVKVKNDLRVSGFGSTGGIAK